MGKRSLLTFATASFSVLAIAFSLPVNHSVTGNVGTVSESGSGNGWGAGSGSCGTGSLSDRILASDNCKAKVDGLTLCKKLRGTNFGFSIPSTATITGVQATVEGQESQAISTTMTTSIWHQLIIAGSPGGTQKTAMGTLFVGPTSKDQVSTVPTATNDLWGASPTYATINNSGFGFEFCFDYDPASGETVDDVEVDHLRMTIHYTTPTNPEPQSQTRVARTIR